MFFGCAKAINDNSKCKFFQWGDSDSSDQNNYPSAFNSRGNAGGFPAMKRTAGQSANGPAKKRKCGICGIEGNLFVHLKFNIIIDFSGHNRKNCSQR